MIKTKNDLNRYLEEDKKALGVKHSYPRFMTDFEWRYEIVLRKAEYYNQFKWNPFRYYYLFMLRSLQLKYQTFIPMYTCEEGLSIAHIGNIRINGNSIIGKYCRIQEGVTVGATDGNVAAPKIGDYVYLGSGAKIIGAISIRNHCQIAAGAVLVKNADKVGTYGGVPAKMISTNDSRKNLLVMIND